MKNLIAFFLLLSVGFSACKKEEESPLEVTKQKIIGKWPLKYTITTTYTDFVIKMDTVTYTPADTLVFSEDGKMVRRNGIVLSTSTYQIDALGENITFSGTPPLTQQISFLRTQSIGLATEKTITVGAKVFKVVVEDQLIK